MVTPKVRPPRRAAGSISISRAACPARRTASAAVPWRARRLPAVPEPLPGRVPPRPAGPERPPGRGPGLQPALAHEPVRRPGLEPGPALGPEPRLELAPALEPAHGPALRLVPEPGRARRRPPAVPELPTGPAPRAAGPRPEQPAPASGGQLRVRPLAFRSTAGAGAPAHAGARCSAGRRDERAPPRPAAEPTARRRARQPPVAAMASALEQQLGVPLAVAG